MVSTLPNLTSVDLSQLRLEIRILQPQLVEWRRRLHQKPELSFQEKLTAAFVRKSYRNGELSIKQVLLKLGIVATIKGEKPGAKVLAIRADMDALPIQELNEVSYRSQHNGMMHACGHDGHIAIAIGTAYYLAKHDKILRDCKNHLPASGRRPWGSETHD